MTGGRTGFGPLYRMKIKSAEFSTSATDIRTCPNWALREFAFIGRSNVGKSSLINSLTQRKQLAKVSGTPGKTQLINFFVVNGNWSLVDLPGYGYARVGEAKRLEFNAAVAGFLEQRNNLRRVFVLIDARHEPQAIDFEFLAWLRERGRPFALIFTKADKQSASQSWTKIDLFKQRLKAEGMDVPEIFLCSAETGAGREAVLASIDRTLTGDETPRT